MFKTGKTSRRLWLSSLLITWLFIMVYTPPLFPFNMLHIVALVCFFVVLIRFPRTFLLLKKCRGIKLFAFGIALSLFLLFITLLFTTHNFLEMYQIAIFIIEVLPCAMLFVTVSDSYGYSFHDILKLILNMALLQSFISILMFFNPMIKTFVVSNFYGHLDVVGEMSYWVKIRYNGLSEGLNFAMPVIQGFIAAIAIGLSYKKSLLYLLYIPPIIFSAAVNARIGIVVFLLSSLAIIIRMMKGISVRRFLKICLATGILVFIVLMMMNTIANYSEDTAEWLIDGLNEIKLFLSGEFTGTFFYIRNMLFLPSGEELVYGSGSTRFFTRYRGTNSDIGYVNDLFLGGIFFVFFLYSSFLYLILWGRTKSSWLGNALRISMVLVMLTVNFKGFAFRQSAITTLFIILSSMFCYYKCTGDDLYNRKNTS